MYDIKNCINTHELNNQSPYRGVVLLISIADDAIIAHQITTAINLFTNFIVFIFVNFKSFHHQDLNFLRVSLHKGANTILLYKQLLIL